MISNYLKALIDSNNRIIIPDFGAFMIQDSPEGKQVSFNDFLKFNDGLLINQIIKTDKISKNQALEKINNFIAEVKKKFAKNEPYKIEGLGILSKDSHGNIKFEKNIKPTTEVKKSPTDIKPTIVLDETQEKTKDEKPVSKEEVKPKPEKKPTVTKPAAEKKPDTKPVVKAETPKPTTTKAEVSKPIAKITTQNKPVDKKPTKIEAKKTKNSYINVLIIAAAIIIILGGGIWAALKFNLFGSKDIPAPQVVEVPTPVIDTIVKDTVTPEPEPMVIEEPAIEENVKKYYLVAGSFKIASNADNFSKKLDSEGYQSEIIARNNGFHCVSIKTYYTWGEVVSGWKKMKESNPGVWILVK